MVDFLSLSIVVSSCFVAGGIVSAAAIFKKQQIEASAQTHTVIIPEPLQKPLEPAENALGVDLKALVMRLEGFATKSEVAIRREAELIALDLRSKGV